MRLVVVVLLAACSNAASPQADAPQAPIDAASADGAAIDAPIGLRILVVNEVAAGDSPDWFEVVNVTGAAIQLDQFVYCDVANDFAKAKPFPTMLLGPGEYYAQDVDDTVSGFKLGSDEELWVYRSSDQALSDGIDWDEGAAPSGESFRRVPDQTGGFATGAQSKGVANP